MKSFHPIALAIYLVVAASSYAQRSALPQSAKAAAPVDLTGYWISLITNSEQWLARMLMPVKGDYRGIYLTVEARRLADSWDPVKDEAAGDQCRAYGAPAIMQVPGRFHLSWEGEQTLRVDIDTGSQTRRLHFGAQPAAGGPQLQGFSTAQWDIPGGRGTEGGASSSMRVQGSTLKVVTTNLQPGYLFKNGIPYGSKAVLTEYFNRIDEPNRDSFLLVTEVLEDPQYFTEPFVRTWQFKKLPDASGWNSTACSIR